MEAEISGVVGAFREKCDDDADEAERVYGKRENLVVVNLLLGELSGVVKGIRLRLGHRRNGLLRRCLLIDRLLRLHLCLGLLNLCLRLSRRYGCSG